MTEQIEDFLSQEDKIMELSDGAIKDIYSRQLMLKVIKERKGYISEDSKYFKGLSVKSESKSLYRMIQEFDMNLYNDLAKKPSIEQAIIDRYTRDIEDPVEVMRHKLIETSKCCGVPSAKLVHENIEKWAETERL